MATNNIYYIPRNGKADVALYGTGGELKDGMIFFSSIGAAFFLGKIFGPLYFIATPIAGLFLNKAVVKWKKEQLPGFIRCFFYGLGLAGYSSAFDAQKKIFVGDNQIINPAPRQTSSQLVTKEDLDGID